MGLAGGQVVRQQHLRRPSGDGRRRPAQERDAAHPRRSGGVGGHPHPGHHLFGGGPLLARVFQMSLEAGQSSRPVQVVQLIVAVVLDQIDSAAGRNHQPVGGGVLVQQRTRHRPGCLLRPIMRERLRPHEDVIGRAGAAGVGEHRPYPLRPALVRIPAVSEDGPARPVGGPPQPGASVGGGADAVRVVGVEAHSAAGKRLSVLVYQNGGNRVDGAPSAVRRLMVGNRLRQDQGIGRGRPRLIRPHRRRAVAGAAAGHPQSGHVIQSQA